MASPLSRVIGIKTETSQVYEWDIRARGLLSDPDAPTHEVSTLNSSTFLIGPMKTHLKHSSVVEETIAPLFVDFTQPSGHHLHLAFLFSC